MAASLSEPETPAEPPADAGPSAHSLQLVDRLPLWCRTSWQFALHVLFLTGCFVFFSFRPLWHSDLWGHLAYGRLIVDSGGIPATEPFMPLADGMPLVDTAWLSQVIGYAAISRFGPTALQFLSAAAITLCLALLAWRFYERTRNIPIGIAAVGAFLWLQSHAFVVIRPQLAGLCCFVGLLTLLTSRRQRSVDWFLVPALSALWANLHGSFVLGIVLLGTFCTGRAIDVVRRTGSPRAAWNDRRARRLLWLSLLAAGAALLNPYGPHLYAEVLTFSSHPNLADMLEWQPLTLWSEQGIAAFSVAVLLIVLMLASPRRVTAREALLLIGLGGAALWSSRFLVWWSPVAALLLALHGRAEWRRLAKTIPRVRGSIDSGNATRRSIWTVVSLAAIWIAFAYTPFGSKVLRGEEPELSRIVSPQTPIRAAEYLHDQPPAGPVFNAMEFGDYLVWKNVPGVFVTSHVHLVPPDVWQHFIIILTADDGWADLLARYRVNTAVLNPDDGNQTSLVAQLRESPDWRVDFEDERSVVFGRVRRIPAH